MRSTCGTRVPRTAPIRCVLNSLYTNNTQNNNYNTFNQFRAVVQGDLFDMPAGPVKLAVGGEHMWQDQQFKLSGGNNTGPTTTGSGYRVFNFDRDIVSAFAEVAVPLVSPEMGIPALHQIDLSLAVRYDDFSDVGDTTNPKYGINWNITEGLRIRANYAESFVAPPIAVIGDRLAGLPLCIGKRRRANPSTLNVPVAHYPEVVNVPGAVEANTNIPCTVGLGVLHHRTERHGDAPSARWRLLADGTAVRRELFVRHRLRAGCAGRASAAAVTFFHNDFIGGVNSPSPASIVASGSPLLTICPTGCTQAQILEFANVANGATIGGSIPPTVYYLIDQSARNWLNLSIEGFDAQFDYRVRHGRQGECPGRHQRHVLHEVRSELRYQPEFSVLNTSGFNGVFPSIQFKARTSVGIDVGKLSADLLLEPHRRLQELEWQHHHAAHPGCQWQSERRRRHGGCDQYLRSPPGVQALDSAGTFEDMSLSLDVRNLTDEDPSFFNGNQGGFMGGAWGYDNYTANPVGRLVTLGVRTNF